MLRVISGKFKGHPLKTVSNKKTRPTSDKVKEALFSSIGPYFQEGNALDLFAGSGGLGIEALSRGMAYVVFVDHDYQALQMIKKNVQQLQLNDSCDIYRNDAFRAIKASGKRNKKFDYCFLDPPYGKITFDHLFLALHEADILHDHALIICEHDKQENLPGEMKSFTKMNESSKTSLTNITLYRYRRNSNE